MDRPFILRGNICIKNEYIISKIIKNKNVEEKREQFIQVLDNNNLDLFENGYKAYIFEDEPKNINLKELNYCYGIKDYNSLINFDVIEITQDNCIRVLFRDDSEDNAIVVTNQCNSNCIMCPDSDIVRNSKENPAIQKLVDQIRAIPDDTKHITITGGEPGLLKNNLITVLKECKENLPNTEFLLLSNGRVFANTAFVDKVKENIPLNSRIAIPIYSNQADLHDEITQAKGSFVQAVVGIKKLLERDIDVEIRIVVMKKNYKNLEEIAKFIAQELPKVKLVNIMAMEMTGNAYKRKEELWINFDEASKYLYNTCLTIIKAGIMVNLYNFPLCSLDRKLYSIARKSITDYKIRYKEECDECAAKAECGGFFNSTINMKDIKVKPIK